VRVTTQVEFAYLGDVFNTIEGAIWQAGYRPEVIDFNVQSVPQGTSTTPQIAQPGRAGGVYIPPGSPAGDGTKPASSAGCPPGYYDASIFGGYLGLDCKKLPDVADRPSECDWETMDVSDYVACKLDIKPSDGVIVGLALAVGGVILLKRLL
jgi:hypothetical protein